MNWVALFSQTGSEIYNVSNELNMNPNHVVTNRKNIDGINKGLIEKFDIVQISNKPNIEEYHNILKDSTIVTLHGFLRIIPAEICEQYNIYNLHPGLITEYPELKGFNPQEKAYKLKLNYSGSVIHKVTAELDSGEILDYIKTDIKDLSLNDIYGKLHSDSTKLWVKFLNNKLER